MSVYKTAEATRKTQIQKAEQLLATLNKVKDEAYAILDCKRNDTREKIESNYKKLMLKLLLSDSGKMNSKH